MTMRRRTLMVAAAGVPLAASTAAAGTGAMQVRSPDGQLVISLDLDTDGRLHYRVQRQGRPVLLASRLGLKLEAADLAEGLAFAGAGEARRVDERYELQVGKRRHIHHQACERDFRFINAAKQHLVVTLRARDDGVAFRYHAAAPNLPRLRFVAEATSFRFAASTRAWLQPMSVAKTGWSRCNPAYEEHYEIDQPVGTPSPSPAGWVFPALFRSGASDWVALSEAGLDGGFHASRLQAQSPGGEYRIGGPPAEEVVPGGALLAEATGELLTPWRLLAVGALGTVADSTLGTDLASPARLFDASRIKPGVASWSWALLKDEFTTFEIQKRFIDYAAEMRWAYTLVDGEWDRRIGHEGIAALVRHAEQRGVGLWLWYNSAGSWNDTPQTPRDLVLTRESRQREFGRIARLGIKGVKVDFFGGDSASMIDYYLAILADAAAAGLLVNFHGATLPRGWARTHPNLMTMEAVKGFEFTTFGQPDQDKVARHAAMLPFTRNLFDPMDFTPMVFGDIPGIERRTRNGFELAEVVLFTSGVQHIAEIPRGMATAPGFVQRYLQALPTQWDDSRFVDGLPGRFVVIARRAGDHWHVAGLNADDTPLALTLDLGFLAGRSGRLITDGPGPRDFASRRLAATNRTPLRLQPHGGFVAVFGP